MAEKGNAVVLTPSQAIEQYQRATESEPKNADKFMELGAAYYVAHRWEDAIIALERAVLLKPDLAHAHYYLGVLYASKGDRARAEKELDDVLKNTKNPILIQQAQARIPSVKSPAELAKG